MPGCLVLVPLRSFRAPKTRLGTVLTDAERTALVEELAAGVLAALTGLDVAVVTDDDDVAAWAPAHGATVVRPSAAGLVPSVAAATASAAADGYAQVAVVHADLADPAELASVLAAATAPGRANDVTAVPDRHGDGTNVLVVPTSTPFTFRYGPGSFEAHRAEAEARALSFVVAEAPGLGWDVDTPDDLERLRS